jgi:hypothetical protein
MEFQPRRISSYSENLLAPLAINRSEVVSRISVPEMSLKQFVSQESTEAPASDERPVLRRVRIPAPIEFAVSLKIYIDKMSGACPLYGHQDHEESSKDDHAEQISQTRKVQVASDPLTLLLVV